VSTSTASPTLDPLALASSFRKPICSGLGYPQLHPASPERGRPTVLQGHCGLDRFPAPSVIVLANDRFSITGNTSHAVITIAAKLTGLIAGSFIAERMARTAYRASTSDSR
jgi:hypothetical protein